MVVNRRDTFGERRGRVANVIEFFSFRVTFPQVGSPRKGANYARLG